MKTHHLAKLFAAALLFTLPQAVHSQVMIDNDAFQDTGTSSSLSISNFTVGNQSNRILVVAVGDELGDGADSVTFGSANLTELGSVSVTGTRSISMWYLLNPAASTDTVNVTLGSSPAGGSAVGVWSIYDAAQSAPTILETAASASLTLNNVPENDFIANIAIKNGNSGPTVTSGVTEDDSFGVGSAGIGFGSTITSSTGDVTAVWSSAENQSAVAFAAIPEPSTAALALLAGGLSLLVGGRRRRND